VKHLVPESAWPRVAGKQVDSQSWDTTLNVVQKTLVGIVVANKLKSLEEDPLIAEALRQCYDLRAKKYLEVVTTNGELAKKYAISPRTVTNWRKEGCPFDKGQWQVLDWMFGRRYLPRSAKEKFADQFWRRTRKAARDIRYACLAIGQPVPDSIREICEG